MAPECLSRKYGRPAFASDVYSVGIIMWELWAKRRVYTGFRNLEENTVWDEETKQHRVDVKLVAKRMASGGQRPEVRLNKQLKAKNRELQDLLASKEAQVSERGGQTREHAMLAKTLGVRILVVAILSFVHKTWLSWLSNRSRHSERTLGQAK